MNPLFPKESKYRAKRSKCMVKRHPHPSALEATVCDLLSAREQHGEISDVKWIVSVQLTKKIRWKVDFRYTVCKTGEVRHAEAKGKDMADYVIKRELWREGYGPTVLEIWKGDWRRPVLVETVSPEMRKE